MTRETSPSSGTLGVPARDVPVPTADISLPPENRDKLLIHTHGGCSVMFPGESGTLEAIMMAGFGRYRVISVDYRMPPEAYFPSAIDDAFTVYKEGSLRRDRRLLREASRGIDMSGP
jgi:acetyl esterase/lipase